MYLSVCPLHGPGHDSSVGEWMYHTVCPPCGPGHNSSVGEGMNLTVCPRCGPGHNSSVGKWMNLTVYPPCGPGHESSVGKWMNLTACPLRGPGSTPSHGGVFQWIFPRLITMPTQPESSWQQWRRTTCGHGVGRPKSNHGQTDDGWKKKVPEWKKMYSFEGHISFRWLDKLSRAHIDSIDPANLVSSLLILFESLWRVLDYLNELNWYLQKAFS